MIRSTKELETRGIEIDLSGPQGNAFYLLATAKRLARDLNKDGDAILTEMKTGDYENLLTVFEREFGDYVTLYRNMPDDDDDDFDDDDDW